MDWVAQAYCDNWIFYWISTPIRVLMVELAFHYPKCCSVAINCQA